MVFHYDFVFIFLMNNVSFHVLSGHFHIVFGEMYIYIFYSFFNLVICLLLLSCRNSLNILNT